MLRHGRERFHREIEGVTSLPRPATSRVDDVPQPLRGVALVFLTFGLAMLRMVLPVPLLIFAVVFRVRNLAAGALPLSAVHALIAGD